jgi:transglutaminase-like putative cysteine protease
LHRPDRLSGPSIKRCFSDFVFEAAGTVIVDKLARRLFNALGSNWSGAYAVALASAIRAIGGSRLAGHLFHPIPDIEDTMKLSIEAELAYNFAADTQVILNLEASRTSDQIILSESLVIQPPVKFLSDTAPYGDRSIRASLSGDVTIRYTALVENNLRQLLPQSGLQHVWSDLPSEVLPFLLPSRFCPSDKFMRFAQREFSGAGDGVARIMAILDWIHRNVDYVAGVSNAETSAERTFVDRGGVCRDFTHLGITLARALGVPARAVSAYALQLDPPDFHAIFEVYIAKGWWLIDPTRLAPIEGIVRIGSGRDASDIAFLTSDKQCQVIRQTIQVSKAP